MNPLKQVTICVPVYNGEKTFEEALSSIVSQDYPVTKIKIFNNASTDKTLEIINKYAASHKNIEVYTSEENVGLEANLTKCILAADNDYCAIMHSDDVYEKNFIAKSVEVLNSHPDCVASFAMADEIDEKGNFLRRRFTPPHLFNEKTNTIDKNQLLPLILKYSNFITCPAVVVRSDIYREKIKLCDVTTYKSSADLEMWFRMVEFGKILFIPIKLMDYRISTASFSFNLAQVRTHKHDLFIVLDTYVKRWAKSLTSENYNDYYFLQLKDQAFRNLNIIRNKKKDLAFVEEVKFNFLIVTRRIFITKWHFKMASAIIATTLIIQILKLFRRGPQ